MAIRSLARRCVISAAVLTSVGCLVSASASATPAVRSVFSHARYHLSYRQADLYIEEVSTSGPGAAWAIASHVNKAGRTISRILLRYGGRRWTTMPYPGQRSFVPESVTALAPADVWLFGLAAGSASALHFSHGSWSNFPLPDDSQDAWLVLSDTDIWVAAGPLQIPGCSGREFGPGCSVASHWNGKNWKSYPVAVSNLTSLAGTSPADIWAAGYNEVRTKTSNRLQPLVFRLAGTTFQPTSLRARRTDYVPELTVLSPHNVWLHGTTPQRRWPEAVGRCITHWNGERWSAGAGFLGQCGNLLLSDGHAGLWVAPELHWTGSELIKFAEPPTPQPPAARLLQGVAVIPGSSAQWIYGWVQLPRHAVGQVTAFIYRRG